MGGSGGAAELTRRLAAAPGPGSWYAVPEEALRFSTKHGDRPFVLARPLTGPIGTGYVRTRRLRGAEHRENLPESPAAWCRTPSGPGLVHPPHRPGHESGCGLTDRGLIPLWFVASIESSGLEETGRRCHEPDPAVVAALRHPVPPGRRLPPAVG
jgi:hypothetical protein